MLQQALSILAQAGATLGPPAGVLAASVSALIVAGGLRQRRSLQQRQGQPQTPDRFELGQTPFASGLLDVTVEAQAVLHHYEALAARQLVRLEMAVLPGLAVRADPRAFREILCDMVARAIEHAPCGHVLMTAAVVHGQVQITVSDDGAQANRDLRASRLREAERLAALHGATMNVDAIPGQGTSVVLQLAAAANGRQPVSDPASVWAIGRQDQKTGAYL